VLAFGLIACMHVCFLLCTFFCLLACFLTHFSYEFTYDFSFFVVCLLVYVHRLVSDETMCNFRNRIGKVQEDLCSYQYLVFCHPRSI